MTVFVKADYQLDFDRYVALEGDLGGDEAVRVLDGSEMRGARHPELIWLCDSPPTQDTGPTNAAILHAAALVDAQIVYPSCPVHGARIEHPVPAG